MPQIRANGASVLSFKSRLEVVIGDCHLLDIFQEALKACTSDPVLRRKLERIVERKKGGRASCDVLDSVEHTEHQEIMHMLGGITLEQVDLTRAGEYICRAADCEFKWKAPSDNASNSTCPGRRLRTRGRGKLVDVKFLIEVISVYKRNALQGIVYIPRSIVSAIKVQVILNLQGEFSTRLFIPIRLTSLFGNFFNK